MPKNYENICYCSVRKNNGEIANVRISEHAYERFYERTTMLSDEEIEEFVANALMWGKDTRAYTGACRDYLLKKANKTEEGCYPITYRGMLILMSKDFTKVITVMTLPDSFIRSLPSCEIRPKYFCDWKQKILSSMYELCSLMRKHAAS